MSRYFTGTLADLEPYTPGEQPKIRNLIKLNTNENPYPPSPAVRAAVDGAIDDLRLYSDITSAKLCAAIAKKYGVQPENVLCGNGSDENLMLAVRAFCDENTPLAFADITYGFYKVWCDLFKIPKHILPLEEDFSIDLTKYYGLEETIVIANPNAPTSLLQPVAALEEVVRRNPGHVVIVDEAYIDFAGPGASCVPLVARYDNLLVVQTFSKSRNLAGARLGFCIGSKGLIADLNRIKFSMNPYNINAMSEAAGAAAMADDAYLAGTGAAILETRRDTTAKLRAMGFTVLDSASNFLFAHTPAMAGGAVQEALRAKNILVRRFDAPRIGDWLRITIGTPAQMQALCDALAGILNA